MAVIEVQDIYKKDADGIFQPLRGNYVKDYNGVFQQFKPGDGVKGADGNWYVLNELIRHIRDSKDNQLYPVKLMPDGNWWMTTNYAFAGNGVVYDNDETHRAAYGGLYGLATAISNEWSGVILPSYAQWNAMINSVAISTTAGRILKSKLNTRDNGANSPTNPTWTYSSDDALGVDQYGFGIVPAGSADNTGDRYLDRGKFASFLYSDIYQILKSTVFNYASEGFSEIEFSSSGELDILCFSVRYIVTDTSILI